MAGSVPLVISGVANFMIASASLSLRVSVTGSSVRIFWRRSGASTPAAVTAFQKSGSRVRTERQLMGQWGILSGLDRLPEFDPLFERATNIAERGEDGADCFAGAVAFDIGLLLGGLDDCSVRCPRRSSPRRRRARDTFDGRRGRRPVRRGRGSR